MNKKIAIALIASMAVATSVAGASPYELQDGKWNVNLGAMISPNSEVDVLDFDGDTSFYGSVTYGLTDRFGIQLDYSHYDSSYHFGEIYGEGHGDYTTTAELDATELNVIYKLNQHINVFAGYVYAGVDYDQEVFGKENHLFSGHTDSVQAGLMGHYPIGDRLQIFTKLAFGNHVQNRQIGLSYEFVDNWAIDVSYRDVEYKDIRDIDFEYDGVRLGVSTSF